MDVDPTLDLIFSNLRTWARLPKYQLERRVDIFLTPYLAALVGARFRAAARLVVPEFPLLASLRPNPKPGKKTLQTVNADYLFSLERDGRAAGWVLFELKTDRGSLDPAQLATYECARELGMRALVAQVQEVAASPYAPKRKYAELVARLPADPQAEKEVWVSYVLPSCRQEKARGLVKSPSPEVEPVISLAEFARLDPALIPAEHRGLWPRVSALLREIDV